MGMISPQAVPHRPRIPRGPEGPRGPRGPRRSPGQAAAGSDSPITRLLVFFGNALGYLTASSLREFRMSTALDPHRCIHSPTSHVAPRQAYELLFLGLCAPHLPRGLHPSSRLGASP